MQLLGHVQRVVLLALLQVLVCARGLVQPAGGKGQVVIEAGAQVAVPSVYKAAVCACAEQSEAPVRHVQ